MPQPPESLPPGVRRALIVATSQYTDPTLRELRAPGHDASALAEVLAAPEIGAFTVSVVTNAPSERLQRAIIETCSPLGPSDLLLLYLSCHGVLDDRGRLYYGTVNTERSVLAATAL